MDASLTWIPPLAPAFRDRPYFARRLPVALIFGAFFLLTIPLSTLSIARPDLMEKSRLAFLYFIVVGNTHFLLTFALYLQTANRRYFTATKTRIAIYFAIPVLIFAFFDLYRALGIPVRYPAFDAGLSAAIRLLNFYHWGRQAFGVEQLLKRRSPRPIIGVARHCESALYYSLMTLMALTYFTGGSLDLAFFPTRVALGVALVLFVSTVRCLAPAPEAAGYLVLQTLSAALAIFSAPLYVFTLAMHYVEYHVVMYPRIFSGPERPRSRGLFYLVLLNLAILASAMIASAGAHVSMGATTLLALCDGLFVCHYFIEAFVWRFSDPHFRQTLTLYFGGR